MQKIFMIAAVLLLAGTLAVAGCVGSDNAAKTGDAVSVYYTLTVNGTELQSNFDGKPLSFTLGAGETVTGFNDGVLGMKVGETKTITVKPEDGYGVYSKDNTQTMTLSDAETALGKTVAVGDKLPLNYGQLTGEVLSIDRDNDTMVLAINHHLAGETLTFTVKLLEIK
ncbi:MAG TPA: FKBP-type peptidyl-prolyl cis-trans isomerase [Methanocorpusculum sp.]|nr:FKBP-type peptidyl-prolyl cis-trans isomerase [Methanocorpusculum sp.]